MAVLIEVDRLRVWRGIIRYLSRRLEGIPNITKGDIRAAVDAADTWIDTNQAAYNTALPNPFRNNATTAQKTLLFCAVAAMRVGAPALRQVITEDID